MYRFFRRNREKVLKYLLIFFLGIVSVGMVVTLAPIPGGDSSQIPANVLASLGDQNITTQDVQQRLTQQFANSPVGNSPVLMAQFAPNVLDEMVLGEATQVEAKRLGLEVSDQELASAIRSYPGLSNNGAFVGVDQYQQMIESTTGLTVAQFEAQLRADLLNEKLRDMVTDAIQVTPGEIRQEFLRRNEKVKIDYVLFDPTQLAKDVPVTPQALQTYFNAHRDRYKMPEQRSVRYV